MKYLSLLILFLVLQLNVFAQKNLYVSIHGSNSNNGSLSSPLKSLAFAVNKAEKMTGDKVHILLHSGTFYLDSTIIINADSAKFKSLTIEAYNNEEVFVSAGQKLSLRWRKFKNGIYVAKVPKGVHFEQLYVNRKSQVLARYPNYNSAKRIFNGTAADAIDANKISGWQNPAGGYVHALHANAWGSLDYKILGKESTGKLLLEGGWQNNRPSEMNKTFRFVENIFEELDTTNEWFLDKNKSLLYYIPPANLNLKQAVIEVSRLKNSIELKGTAFKPLKNIHIQQLTFMHNERSFMDTKEPLLRSDWRIYRGGAVLLAGTENCKIANCTFEELGGNAIMLSDYNKEDTIAKCHIFNIGASAICAIGDAHAVRSPSFRYQDYVSYNEMDKTPEPGNNNYPQQCLITNNLIHDIGRVEKQVAGVEIDIASKIRVSHNSIYNTPRAGINIGDGCFGGHVIAYNDVFNTVLETGDHGAFNAWGRDRFWAYKRKYMDSLVAVHPELILLDAVYQNVIRNNRFQCSHGWDIDLDDGSSNYHIYNNVCLSGGLKLREGFFRIVENNIMLNNTFHPHVWFKNSGDVFTHNIVMKKYAPIGINWWGKMIDDNLFPGAASLQASQKNGNDKHSLYGNSMFINASVGDYRVQNTSPALKIGFKNFSMQQFGVQYPPLKKIAKTPEMPTLQITVGDVVKSISVPFLGGMIKSVNGLGDRSAYGLPDETGVIIVSVGKNNRLTQSGLQQGDVIRRINNTPVKNVKELLSYFKAHPEEESFEFIIIRNQNELKVQIQP